MIKFLRVSLQCTLNLAKIFSAGQSFYKIAAEGNEARLVYL